MSKFVRSETVRFLRLGKKRRKLQKWRRPRGRHNKIRRKRVSYSSQPSIGYQKPRSERGLVKGHVPEMVHTLNDLNKIKKNSIVILSGRVSAKKRLEILKKAEEIGLKVLGASGRNT